jgi:hypothetical protein
MDPGPESERRPGVAEIVKADLREPVLLGKRGVQRPDEALEPGRERGRMDRSAVLSGE